MQVVVAVLMVLEPTGGRTADRWGDTEWWHGNGSHPQVVVVVVIIVAGGGEWSWMVMVRCGYGG
jgi:hypothetical protein